MSEVPIRHVIAAIFFAIVLPFDAPATAQQSDNWKWCANSDGKFPSDLQIGGCTAIIQSGKETPERLAVAFNNRANAWDKKGDIKRGIADAKMVVQLSMDTKKYCPDSAPDPKHAASICDSYAVATRIRGHSLLALAIFSRALEIYPKHIGVYVDRGQTWFIRRDYKRAIEDFDSAIRLNEKYGVAYLRRGRVRKAMGNEEEAIVDFTEAARVQPNLVTAYEYRAEIWLAKGQYDKAIEEFSEMIRLAKGIEEIDTDPISKKKVDVLAAALNSRCWVRAIAGRDLQEALLDCNQSLRLKPDVAATLDSRGFTYLRLGQIDKATSDYDAALKVNPKQAESLYGRGLAKRKKGDKTGAEADIAKAKAIRSTIADEFARYGGK